MFSIYKVFLKLFVRKFNFSNALLHAFVNYNKSELLNKIELLNKNFKKDIKNISPILFLFLNTTVKLLC